MSPVPSNAERLEAQYNPRVAVADFERYLDDFAALSRAARGRLEGTLDVAYGASALQTLDVFPAAGEAPPINLFIHGGYWRGLDKSDHSYLAEPLVAAGATTVVLNYDLCPSVSVDDIVGQVRAGVAWVWRHGAELGGDPERLYLSGHSAGGHLAVMAMAHDWAAREGLPADLIKGVTAVSGVYDLAPVLDISVNEEIGLTPEMARRNSPLLAPPRPACPLLLAIGERETPAWIAQSVDFAAACRTHGVDVELLRVPGEHHFSIALALADPARALLQAVLAQMGLG